MMNRFVLTLLLGVLCVNAYTQCGPASITVTDYCPDQYAEFTVNDPDPLTRYHWYQDAAGTTSLGYGPDGIDGKYFVSPSTYPTGSGTQTFYYQREIEGVVGGPDMASHTNAGIHNGPSQANYSLDYTATADFELTEITVLIYQNGMDQGWYTGTHRIQVELEGNFSNWYHFDNSNVTKINGDYYAVTIPIDRDGLGNGLLGTAGTNTIQLYGASGTDPNGTASANTTFAFVNSGDVANSYTIGSGSSTITIDQDGNDQTGWWGTARPAIFDWNVNFYCPLESVSAVEETNLANCCTPVAAQPTVTTGSGETVFELPFSETLTAGNSNAAHYFEWYHNGAVVASGYGVDTYNATAVGNYEVRVVEDAGDINKLSCYNESSILALEEQILFAIASSENICIGDQITLTADGALSNISWTPNQYLTDNTAFVTSATPTQTITYTVTAEVPSGNLVENWDFEDGNTAFDVSAGIRNAPASNITYQNDWAGLPNDPGPHPMLDFQNYGSNGNGVYAIIDTYVSQGGWALAYDCGDHTSGSGNFMLHDAMTTNTMNTYGVTDDLDAYFWKQDVVVEANTTYDFTAWFANASVGQYNNPPQIQMYVNDVPILGTPWQQAANSTEWNTCDWHEAAGTWNSGAYSGPVEIKIVELSHQDSGNDFLVDDIMFSSGTSIQSDDVTITVNDCFTATAQQNTNCVNDSSEIEFIHNGLFTGWTELGGGTASIKDPNSEVTLVSPSTDTRYVGCAQYPLGNLLTNGDFELGDQGFGSDYTPGTGGGNYMITDDANNMNGTWFINNTDVTTGTGNMMVVDGGSTVADIWNNTVDVVAGEDYAFSVWVQNVHVNMDNPAEMRFYADGNPLGQIDLPDNDQNWIQFFTTWTATTTGTITISIQNENTGFLGNDFAIDDIVFAPLFDETRCDTVDVVACTPPCQPPTALSIDQTGPIQLCAGSNQTLSATYTLDPSPLNGYYYTWFQDGTPVYGPTTTYSDEVLNSIATGDAGTYTIRIEDGNNDDAVCYLEESIVVDVEDQPSTASAGTNQTICETTTSVNLSANNPASGTGTWSLVSGSGTLSSTTSTTPTVTSLGIGANVFRWTISTGTYCPDETDDVTITVDAAPSASAAGADQDVCETPGTATMAANTPVSGTGTWVTMSGSGTFSSTNSPTATVSGLSAGANTFRWTISTANSCPDETDDVTINVDAAPSAAVAGSNQTICASTATMAATAPATGTGTWSLISGTGSATSPNSATSGITGLTTGTNTFRWTVSNGVCPDETDEVDINVSATVTTADAGPAQTLCAGSTATMAANAAGGGETGTWSLVSGSGTITSPNSETTTITGLGSGANVFRWTIDNTICPVSTDEVTITIDDAPSAAVAGTNQTVCETPGTATMAATAPATGTGTWTLQSGTGTITTPSSATTGITGLGAGANVFRWTVSNGVCPDETDEVTITVDAAPTTANAGPAQTECEGTTITMAANTPATGTGVWSLISGTGSADTPGDPASTVSGLTAGSSSTFRWTISNGTCPDETDEVVITIDQAPTAANVGADLNVCIADPINLTGNNPSVGTGIWTTGPATTGGTIDTPTDPTSSVSGMSGGDVLEAIWTISNGVCPSDDDTITITATGVASPSVTLNVDNSQVCEGTAITFTATGNNGGSAPTYEFFDGTNASLQGPGPSNTFTIAAPNQDTTIYVEMVSNSSCLGANPADVQSTTVGVQVDLNPSTADAGPDQTVCTTDATLAAVAPTTGTGSWSVTSGTGTVTTINDPGSQVTGLAASSTVTLQWEVSNGVCPTSTDEVDITRTGSLTSPNAGPDQTICETGTATLAANAVAGGETGTWTTSGDGTFSNANDEAATYTPGATDITNGTATLTWSIDNGVCPVATDEVDITIDGLPTTAAAGADDAICTDGYQLSGNNPTVGTGAWTSSDGGVTFDNINLFDAQASNIQTGVTTFTWTITNGVCPASTDDVDITRSGSLTTPLAGADQTICETGTATMAANAAGGGETGTWSTSGDGTFDDVNSETAVYTPGATDITTGTVTLTWTMSNGVCPDATNTMDIQIDAQPSTAAAGTNQTLCTDQTTLAATAPTSGTGMWTVVSGSGTVSTPTDEASTVTGLVQGGTLTLRWTVSNGVCPSSTDDVDITRVGALTTPNAGFDATICETGTATLSANAANTGAGETGTWTTGGDGSFDNVNDEGATYTPGTTDITNGTVTLSWTIDNGGLCPSATDDMIITLDALPTTANAGTDQTVCVTSLNLNGNTAIVGTGTWTTVTGPATIDNINDEGTQVFNLQDGTNEFQWAISNGACPASTDIVRITKSGDLTTPDAGSDDNICETAGSYTLGGNSVDVGNGETGTWSVEAGTATITNVNDPTTTITGIAPGTVTMRWTISNGICPDAFNEVDIVVDQDPGTATLGNDTTLCGVDMTLNGNAPVVGTGLWAISAGNGTLTDPTNPSTTITGLSGQTELSWTLTNGTCISQDGFRINASTPVTPDVQLTANNSNICEGDNITFTAFNSGSTNNGTNPTYEFYEDGISVQGPSTLNTYTTNTYTQNENIVVILRPSLTCVTDDSVVALASTSVSPAPTVGILEPDAQVCETQGYTLTAVASSGTSLQWYDNTSGSPVALFGENGATLNVPYSGTFIAVVNNTDLTCSAVSSNAVNVTIDQMPGVEAGNMQTLFVGDQISMQGSVSNATNSYWSPDNGEFDDVTNPTSVYTGLVGGLQTYTLTAVNGACSDSDQVTLQVRVPITIPNVFTPNTDGENDTWIIEGLETYSNIKLEVFNRWGSPVYNSTPTYTPWDGLRAGEQMPVATYYYILTIDAGSDEEQIFTGSVTLVR